MLKLIILTLLSLPAIGHASIDLTDFPEQINEQEISYKLTPPNGFKRLSVSFDLTGEADNAIIEINIDIGTATYKIDADQLNIDFAPNLNQIQFYKGSANEKQKSVFFSIHHGAPQKIECGKGHFEYIQEVVKITVFLNSEPLVEKDSSFIDSCVRITAKQKKSGQ